MPVYRCTRCSYQAELGARDGAGACPDCGARLEVVSGEVTAAAPRAQATPAPDSPKSRMLACVEGIALDADDVAAAMGEAIRRCIDEIRDGSRSPAGELGALLDAGRSFAVASFGIWNELRSRSEALEEGTPARRRAELVADEALCAGDAGVMAVIRAIDEVLSGGQRLEPVELDALVNLWQTVHDFDRYPLAALRVKCLQHGYGLCDGEGVPVVLDEKKADQALYEVFECAEAGNAECVLSICEDVLKFLPDNRYAQVMAGVSRMVIACDTVVSKTRFHDLDEVVRDYIVELRGEPFKRVGPAVAQGDGDEADEAGMDGSEQPSSGEGTGEDAESHELLDFFGLLGPEDPYDYEVDTDNLWRRSSELRELAVCLDGLVADIAEHTRRVLEDCEAGRTALSEEVVASLQAQHDDVAGALSQWMLAITREYEDMLDLGLRFDEDWEVARWKRIFLSVAEDDRDWLWQLGFEDLRREFEATVTGLEMQEEEVLHRIADTEIAYDRKMREAERARTGDPAVLERLRTEASMLEYDLAMQMLLLDEVRECYESRDWDELDEMDS